MSIESAIDRHTDAVNNLAAAILAAHKLITNSINRTAECFPTKTFITDFPALTPADEIAASVTKVEEAAKDEKADETRAIPRAELEKAIEVAKAEALLKKAIEEGPEAKALTYEGDIKPALVALGKNDKQALVDLLAHFSVKKGPDIKPEQFTQVLARANQQLGA